jgi:hypothetical protein
VKDLREVIDIYMFIHFFIYFLLFLNDLSVVTMCYRILGDVLAEVTQANNVLVLRV